jgi:formiminoglutamate deiminase
VTATVFHAEHAWLGGDRVEDAVEIRVADGRISSVRPGVAAAYGAVRLPGVTLPGLANGHSHAFHRALRGRTHRGSGTFWTWREDMYAVAARLTPDHYRALARAVYAEMALAGITCVGEFHYLHHGPDGTPYADPNAFGEALIEAAGEAGIRITLLDACYLSGGFGDPGAGASAPRATPLAGPQVRFGDGDAVAWAERVSALRPRDHARIGAAIHSVRAVPADQLATVVGWTDAREAPLHVHLSEQRAENEACLAVHGCTPTQLLEAHGALGPRCCAVHATHLTDADVDRLGGSATCICMCPTTERDLADGIGPAGRLARAGSPLALGSDSNAIVDPFEEARALELNERLATERRGHWPSASLLRAATVDGHRALGWPEAGVLAAGAPADFVTVGLDSVRLAGTRPETALESVVFAAGAADVREVVVAGRRVVADGRHLLVDDVIGQLDATIAEVLA